MNSSSFAETRPDQMMETLHFHCQHCAMPLSVPSQLAGVSGPCPGCGETIAAPVQVLQVWQGDDFSAMVATGGAQERSTTITALPSAASGKVVRTQLQSLLHSTPVRFAAYLALLATVIAYYGLPNRSAIGSQPALAQVEAPVGSEQRTVVSSPRKEAYADTSNLEPRFSAASRRKPVDAGR